MSLLKQMMNGYLRTWKGDDTFDDINPELYKISSSGQYSSYTIVPTGLKVAIVNPTSTTSSYGASVDVNVLSAIPANTNFETSVTYSDLVFGAGDAQFIFKLTFGNNLLRVLKDPTKVRVQTLINSVWTDLTGAGVADSTRSGMIKFVRTGSTISVYTSANGTTFTKLADFTNATYSTASMVPGMQLWSNPGSGSTARNFYVTYNKFRLVY